MPPTLRIVEQGFRAPHRSAASYPIDAKRLKSFPTAALGVRVGDAPAAVMALARRQNEALRWVSADRVIFLTQSGVLVQTRGLLRDLAATQWLTANPLAAGAEPDSAPRVYRKIDLRRGADLEKGVEIESSFEVMGHESIQLLDGTHETHRIRERVDVRAWRWSCENEYWIEIGTGLVRRSVQQFCPEVGPIRLELLKPPGAAE